MTGIWSRDGSVKGPPRGLMTSVKVIHNEDRVIMMIDVYGHFCAHGRLNGPSDLQR